MFDARRVLVKADLLPTDTYTTLGFWNVSVAQYGAANVGGRVGLFVWNSLLVVAAPIIFMAFVTTLPKLVSKTPLWPLMFAMIGAMIVAVVIIFAVAQASFRWSVRAQFKNRRKT